jgi:vacuolar iron transporter family protein
MSGPVPSGSPLPRDLGDEEDLLHKATRPLRQETRPHPTRLSDFILGSQDGIVNVLGIILGLSAAPGVTSRIILVAALAAMGAESIAMSAVAYSSTLSRRRLYFSERAREIREMKEVPETEREDVRHILSKWGFSGTDLEELVERICRNPRAMLELMMSFELGLPLVEEEAPLQSGLLVGWSTLAGHLVPILPFFFLFGNVRYGVTLAIAFSALALFITGWYEARVTGGKWFRYGLQMMFIGLTGGFAGFVIGYAVGHIPGL